METALTYPKWVAEAENPREEWKPWLHLIKQAVEGRADDPPYETIRFPLRVLLQTVERKRGKLPDTKSGSRLDPRLKFFRSSCEKVLPLKSNKES